VRRGARISRAGRAAGHAGTASCGSAGTAGAAERAATRSSDRERAARTVDAAAARDGIEAA
jgi:hypothetical protein